MKKVRGRGRSPVAHLCGRGYVEKRPALHEHSDIIVETVCIYGEFVNSS